MKKFFSLLASLNLIFLTHILNAQTITRASIDIGSGATKMTIARFNSETNQIEKILFQIFEPVELKKDLISSNDNKLSEQIEKKLIATLQKFKEKSQPYRPKQWSAFGSSVFRTAKNGQDIINRAKESIGIPIYLLKQEQEAVVGFNAASISQLNSDEIIAWESGHGSFQITTLLCNKFEMYGTEFAYIDALKAVYDIRGIKFDPEVLPDQLNLEEALAIAEYIKQQLPKVPSWLSDTNKKVVAIGNSTSIFALASMATSREMMTKSQIWGAILDNLKKEKAAIIWPGNKKEVEVTVGLLLAVSIMDYCGIDSITYCKTNGGCEGFMLLPEYWQ